MEGCISSKFCGVTADYEGKDVEFTCPDGIKDTPLFDVDEKGRKRDFGSKLDAEIEEHYKELTMKYAAALDAKRKANAELKHAMELAKKEEHEIVKEKEEKEIKSDMEEIKAKSDAAHKALENEKKLKEKAIEDARKAMENAEKIKE